MFYFKILAIGDNAELEEHVKLLLTNSIEYIGGEFISTIITKCNKEKVKEELIRLSDTLIHIAPYVVIVISNITLDSVHTIAYEAIMEVIDNNIFEKLTVLLSGLKEILMNSFKRAICGVRKQTLIINMCGSYESAAKCLMENGYWILEIVGTMYSMHAPDEATSNNDDNNSDASPSPNISEEDAENISMAKRQSSQNVRQVLRDRLMRKKADWMRLTAEAETVIGIHETPDLLISVKDAIIQMHNVVPRSESVEEIHTEIVNIRDAYGRILAIDICSLINVTHSRISAKHGYAVLASDGRSVKKVLTAHTTEESYVVSGTCMRVRRGEPIPIGATAVVTYENTKIIKDDNDDRDYFNIDDMEYEINVLIAPKENENISNPGYNYEIRSKERIVRKFTRLGPAELGILALCGPNMISVIKVLSVGLLSIAGNKLEDSFLRRIDACNKITLISLLKENGFNSLIDFEISAHESNTIIKKLEDALEIVDVLLIMVRANENNILKSILQENFNATIHFGQVNMKPGKSTMFATCVFEEKKKYLLCMSANPAIVPIVAHVLLLPFLNYVHYFDAAPINVQTHIESSPELHSCPKFSWTTLHWTEENNFPKAYCSGNLRKNYQSANAFLLLPPRTPEIPKLPMAFVEATLTRLKSHRQNTSD